MRPSPWDLFIYYDPKHDELVLVQKDHGAGTHWYWWFLNSKGCSWHRYRGMLKMKRRYVLLERVSEVDDRPYHNLDHLFRQSRRRSS